MCDKPRYWDSLSPDQKYLVDRYIQTLLSEQQPLPLFQKEGREVVERKVGNDGISYQREKIKCGKSNCKCSKGGLHGPYWYAYWREGGRVKSRYVGKWFKPIQRG